MTTRMILRGLPLILVLAGVGYLLELSHQSGLFDTAWIDVYVRGRGLTGELLFLMLGAAFTAAGVPRQIIAFLGGYGFGLLLGGLVALAATVLGCCASFWLARLAGRSWVAARMPRRMRGLEAFIQKNTFTTTLLIRFLPAGNNLLTNLAAGVSGVRALPFLAGSALGYVPQTLVFALLGSGETLAPTLRAALAIVLFLGSGALGVYLFGRYRNRSSWPGPGLERELEADLEVVPEGPSAGDRPQ